MQEIYRRTPMPKCDLNKVAKQLYWNRTSAWLFSCKFAAYFPRINSGWLLLFIKNWSKPRNLAKVKTIMTFSRLKFISNKTDAEPNNYPNVTNVAKLSWRKKYIFKKKISMIFTKAFFFKKSYLFKINICMPFQKI